MVRHNSRGEARIVSYVVSGIGFLGAGVIFKDSGSVRGLNTAATIWCSAFSGRWRIAFNPAQVTGEEQEVTYGFEPICRPEDEAPMRALLLQAMSRSSLTLTGLRSEDIEGTPKMRVTAQIKGLGRQDEGLEQIVVRLSLEAGVSSVSWAVHPTGNRIVFDASIHK
jgi:putative Mg2+ transporter-C (MgtC) family protein